MISPFVVVFPNPKSRWLLISSLPNLFYTVKAFIKAEDLSYPKEKIYAIYIRQGIYILDL